LRVLDKVGLVVDIHLAAKLWLGREGIALLADDISVVISNWCVFEEV
jgi:hypothetical protein